MTYATDLAAQLQHEAANPHQIYVVFNTTGSNMRYYGVTDLDLESRLYHHMKDMRKGTYNNDRFKAEWDKYPTGWAIELVGIAPKREMALEFETYLIQRDPATSLNKYKNPLVKRTRSCKQLSQDTVDEILAAKGTEKVVDIAKRLGVSKGIVSNVQRGKHKLSHKMDDMKAVLKLKVQNLLEFL